MPSPDAHEAKRLFLEALERPRAERAALLERACGGDASLRTLVESLLVAAEEGRGLLERPPAARAGAPSDPEQLLGTFLGPYKLLQVIGEGGFGTVYMAEQARPVVRRVAVKVLKAGMDTREVIARFEAERQALALMDHPNIARVLDAGEAEGGRPYFVMELVHGVPITQFCDDARLPVPERLELFRSVCLALQHAHQKGVIHRDVKPTNVLVTTLDDKPLAKVIDFGIAKAMNQRLTDKTLFTRFGQFLGTPAYMSPEQAQFSALDVDTRSDVYSLGVLLYELLTGVTPFDSKRLLEAGIQEVQRVIREVEPPRPSTRLSTLKDLKVVADRRATEPAKLGQIVRGDLDWVVMKCLEKDRARRYDSAGALAADVERYLTRRPVEATPPSARYRLHKLVQRNRALVLGASAVAAALVIGLCVSTAGFLSASRQRDAKQSALWAAQAAQAEAEDAAQQLRAAKGELEQQGLELRRSLYVRSLGFVGAELQAGNRDGARELLEQCPPEERGWEWSHLWLVAHPGGAARASLGSTGGGRDLLPMRSVFSADGRRVASSFTDGRIVVRETDGLRQIRDLQAFPAESGEEGLTSSGVVRSAPLGDLALSADGRLLAAVGTEQHALKLWDVDTGAEQAELARSEGVWAALVFSLDGGVLAARRLRADLSWAPPTWWELPSGARHELTYARAGDVPSTDEGTLAIVDDSHSVIGIGPERMLDTWDLDSNSVWSSHRLSDQSLHALAGGQRARMYFIGYEHESRVHQFEQEIAVLPGVARGAGFAFDGRLIALSEGPRLSVFKAGTGELLRTFATAGDATALAFAPGGRLLAAGVELETLDVSTDDPYCTLRTPRALNGHAEFTQDGAFLAVGTSSADHRSVRIFEVETGQLAKAFENSGAFALDPRGEAIALAEGSAFPGLGPVPPGVALRDLRTGVERGRLVPLKGTVSALAFSPDGRRLAVATVAPGDTSQTPTQLYTPAVEVWDVERAQLLASFEGGVSFIEALSFSPDGARLLTSGNGERQRLFDVETARLVESYSYAASAVFSPDARLLARPHPAGGVEMFDARDGKVLRRVGRIHRFTGLAFLPDGRTLAGTTQGRVVLWDLNTDSELLSIDPPPQVSWTQVAASPDGARLAAVGQERVDLLESSLPDDAARHAREAAFVEQRADELLARLKQDLATPEDVSDWLARNRNEREDVRKAALALLDEPVQAQADRLEAEAWFIAVDPYETKERWSTAVRLAESAVELLPHNGEYRNTLGLALFRYGDLERAAAELRRADELNRREFPDGFALDAAFLAMVQVGLGDDAGALATLARAERLFLDQQWGFDRGFWRLMTEAETAVAGEPFELALEGLYPSPEALRRCAERRERLLGAEHPAAADARNRLADCYSRLDRPDEALAESRRAHELALACGEDLPCLVRVSTGLVHRLREAAAERAELGLHAEQAALCAEALAVQRSLAKPDPFNIAYGLDLLAAALLAAGDPAAAELVARELVALRKELYVDAHPDVWTRYSAQSLLADVLLARAAELAERDPAASEALLAEAESLLLETCERMHPWPVHEGWARIEIERGATVAFERLIYLYEAREIVAPGRGDLDRAESWRQKLAGRKQADR